MCVHVYISGLALIMVSFMTVYYTILALVFIPAAITLWDYIKWILRIRHIGKQVDKIPGPARNFITGNITQV